LGHHKTYTAYSFWEAAPPRPPAARDSILPQTHFTSVTCSTTALINTACEISNKNNFMGLATNHFHRYNFMDVSWIFSRVAPKKTQGHKLFLVFMGISLYICSTNEIISWAHSWVFHNNYQWGFMAYSPVVYSSSWSFNYT